MAFHINDKKGNKSAGNTKNTFQGGSKFIAKPSGGKTTGGGAPKKPVKTGGARGS
jgi:hypothetical protein